MFQTPILLLIFNRPDTTLEVLKAIRAIKPAKLFIVADGPRNNKPGDLILCEKTRQVALQAVDWECELITDFRKQNLGCGVGVYTGITWFFNQVDKGIILEDDCLPDLTFFKFCEELLNHYESNDKVMHISGNNFQFGKLRGTASYYFSKYTHNWGWATWKRAWSKFQFKIDDLSISINNRLFEDMLLSGEEIKYWKNTFEELEDGKADVWDGQWLYSVWKHKGVSILPNKNLVKNIGFNQNATHTFSLDSILSNIKTKPINKIIHNDKIAINQEADQYSFERTVLYKLNFLGKVKSKIKFTLQQIKNKSIN